MTREEAIRILKYNSNVIHKTINGETNPNEVEALDMAIEALEQEPCDITVAFQLGTAFGFAKKYDEMDKVMEEVKKAIEQGQKPHYDCIGRQVADLSKRVETLEKQIKEDKEEQLKKLKEELDYAKFRCAL